jgi:hypothetical protein
MICLSVTLYPGLYHVEFLFIGTMSVLIFRFVRATVAFVDRHFLPQLFHVLVVDTVVILW